MENFEAIWKNFEYIIEEMEDGMAFFEGYIVGASKELFRTAYITFTEPEAPGFYADHVRALLVIVAPPRLNQSACFGKEANQFTSHQSTILKNAYGAISADDTAQ